jgi:hypothetical protein
MRRPITILLALIAVAAVGGCGGSHHPEEEIANAAQNEEKAKGDLLLAEVEYAQAGFREAPEQFAGNRPKIAKVQIEDVREAHHLQRECHEGNGLESCDSIEAIRGVVEELDEEARGSLRMKSFAG